MNPGSRVVARHMIPSPPSAPTTQIQPQMASEALISASDGLRRTVVMKRYTRPTTMSQMMGARPYRATHANLELGSGRFSYTRRALDCGGEGRGLMTWVSRNGEVELPWARDRVALKG